MGATAPLRRIRAAMQAVLLLAAMLLACSASAAMAAGATWTPNDDDSLLFDVRVGKWRLGDGVRGYQMPAGVCVDFADMVMALDLPIRVDRRAGRASGWLFEERRGFTLDRDSGLVEIAGRASAVPPDAIVDTPEGWCIGADTLAGWFGVQLDLDMGNALIFVKSDRKLPFELAEERKERAARIRPARTFDLASLPQADTPYAAFRPPSVDATLSVLGRAGNGQGQIDARYELFASGEIAGASVDARLSSDQRARPQSLRVRAYRADPGGALLGPLGATFVGAGDVTLAPTPLAAQSIAGRGAFVTNRPLDRADAFDRTSFTGELPAGWDAELYRNDQLIAFATDHGDGRYEFQDVPLLYGNNRFEILLYGPQGQLRREGRQFNVGLDSIPARRTWYWAGAVEADRNLIDFGTAVRSPSSGWRGGFGIEHGIDSRTSIGASAVSLVAYGERRHFGELLLRRALGGALIQASAALDDTGHWAAETRFLAQVGGFSLTGEAYHAPGRFVSDRFDGTVRSLVRLGSDISVRLGRGALPLRIEGGIVERRNGDRLTDVGARMSFNIGRLQLAADYDLQRLDRSRDAESTMRQMLGLRASGRIGGIRVRADARYRIGGGSGLEQALLTADWRVGDRADWRMDIGHDGTTGRTRLRGGLIRRFTQFTVGLQGEVASDGGVGLGIDLAASFGPDPAGRGIRITREPQAVGGQVLARVFQDNNGDGIRQAGEPLLRDVEITAGLSGRGPPTNAEGQAVMANLAAFKPVLIGIDAATLADPGFAPALVGKVVTPRPGVTSRVDLPVAPSGQIEAVIVSPSGMGQQGLAVELVDSTAAVVHIARTDFDGYLLFEGVAPGRYRLRLSALSAGAIDADQALDAIAEVRPDALLVQLGTIVVKPAVRIAANGR